MATIDFESNAQPVIAIVSVEGDLRLWGWDQPQFVAEVDDENDLRIDRDGDHLIVHAQSDCTIHLPHQAQVSVDTVGGDARVKSLEQKLTMGSIDGDLTLAKVGGAAVGGVGGDLSAKRIAGDLQVGTVGGDLEAEEIDGAFQAGSIGGDLKLSEVQGAIHATADGDIKLSVTFSAEQEYALNAGGDLECRLGPGSSARLALNAGGELRLDVKSAQVEGSGSHKTVTVGGGAAAVSLLAGGDLRLLGLAFNPDNLGDLGENLGTLGEGWTARFETQMADFERQMAELRAGLNTGPSREDAEKIAARMRRAAEKVEKVQRAAQQKAEAARRQAEREAEHARRMADLAQQRAENISRKTGAARGRRPWTFQFETPRAPTPPRPAAPADPVTDEERLVILRMVEQGKISVADAEKLLAALENRP